VQNMTPFGGQRGMVLARSGGDVVFDTGTERREWNRTNELIFGPNGAKRSVVLSDSKMEVPSLA
jgi:hypothetical protein